jgi:hypothetical protein
MGALISRPQGSIIGLLMTFLSSVQPAPARETPRAAAAPSAEARPQIQDRVSLGAAEPGALDFIRIDNPQEVALLPALDPAVQFAMWTAFSSAAMTGLPHVDLTVEGDVAGRLMSIAYHVDRSRMAGEGFIGASHVNERANEPETGVPVVHVTGKIGQSEERFDISIREDGYHLDGQFGTIPVNVTINFEEPLPDTDEPQFLTMRGTIGPEAYEMKTHLGGLNERGEGNPVLQATGHLGNLPIQKTYTMVADGPDGVLEVRGDGTIGDRTQRMSVILTPGH